MKSNKQSLTEQQLIEHNRKMVFKWVNRGVQEPINRLVFKQSSEEKIKAWEAKRKWKEEMIKCYPDHLVRKQMNNPNCL